MEDLNGLDPRAARRHVKQSQKAWKFIFDANHTSLADLNRTAVEDGVRKVSYGLMFREWERYASVFSALGIGAENHSRVGVLGSTCAEVIFAFYGLNMVGADVSLIPSYAALQPRKLLHTIREEHLTDFIVADDFAQADLIGDLFAQRKKLGLRKIILLHVPVAGVTVHPALSAAQEVKYLQLQFLYRSACMDHLLKVHAQVPVNYAAEESGDTACILHTSGTTSGAGKPVALSDKALNAAAACFYKMEGLALPWGHLVTATIVDLSNAYGIIDQVHVPFAMGATVVCVPGNALNPWLYKAVPEHGISFLFTISAMFEHWIKTPDRKGMDFSSLRFVVLGGASVSAADKRRYLEFLREHGAGEITMLNGYGISELGGACCLSTAHVDDEAIGFPLPGVQARVCEEEGKKVLSAASGPCEGVLYLTSPSMATVELDGKTVIRTELIEGRPYVCTNDLVRMEPSGKLTFLGRASRYFLNEEGRKFESARLEAEFARQDGVERCAVAPVYIKTTHDNIPMLCVQTAVAGENAKVLVLDALRRIFIMEKTLKPDHIPCRVMILRELPRNGNGKIDLFRLSRGEAEGEVYTVETVCLLDRLADFRLKPYTEGPADMIREVFDGISADFKESLPFHKGNTNDDNTNQDNEEEETEMANNKKALEAFSAMNRMGRQMMKSMMGQAAANAGKQQGGKPFGCVPGFHQMKENVRQMNKKAAEQAQDAQAKARQQAENMIPQMRAHMDQMIACMNLMNQTALNMMQTAYNQNLQLMNQFMDTVEKQAATAPEKAGETVEEAAPETSEEAKQGEEA